MTMRISLALFALGATLATAAAELPTVELNIKGQRVVAEVAATEATRTVGLMNRFSLQPDHGMLFVFKQPALSMLPFSVGPRNCIGEHLARMEMQMHLMIIGKRLRLRYAPSGPPALAAGVNLRSADDFVMTPELR